MIQIKPREEQRWAMNLMVGDLHITSNGKIRVGGDEAMEPNLESLGRSRGGDDDEDGCDGCIIIILQTTGTQKPRVSQSRWRSEAEDEARWIYKKE